MYSETKIPPEREYPLIPRDKITFFGFMKSALENRICRICYVKQTTFYAIQSIKGKYISLYLCNKILY